MKSIKKLAVCGSSWLSGDPALPGTSFSELLCEKHGWELLNLARNGCTNFGVALQVEHVIKARPDFVILSPSPPLGIDIPIINEGNQYLWDQVYESFDYESWQRLQPVVYDKNKDISNVRYEGHDDLASKNDFLVDPTLMSDSIHTLAFPEHGNNAFYNLPQARIDALKSYMMYLHDGGVKRQIDAWIISNACHQLQHNNIPFLIYCNHLFKDEFARDIEWIKPIQRIGQEFKLKDLPLSVGETRYHVSKESAKTLADYVESRIINIMNS
jgi:hypothetical protein